MPALDAINLEEVGFWVAEYRIDWTSDAPVQEHHYGTKLYAWYRTKDHASMRDFVFVQFIRGCTFETRSVEKSIMTSFNTDREFFGKTIPFNHPVWVIDSTDEDPAYWSSPENGDRHALFRWGATSNTFPDVLARYPRVSDQAPLEPHLFISDYPQGGGIRWNRWNDSVIMTNGSFEFKTCLYKASDVPVRASPDAKLPEPIVCVDWSSSYIYDYNENKMTSPTGISPTCTRAPRQSGVEETPQ
jgi:hypothetical protein